MKQDDGYYQTLISYQKRLRFEQVQKSTVDRQENKSAALKQ